ncbi:MAG: ETC complex I subunit [Alphaproteobacteria bacterium]|nr:ETC complex I subunit [Alphaproteobacteria bacterium]
MEKTVQIFRRPKNAMQSGRAQTAEYCLNFDPTPPPVSDPLMGWTSSSDTRSQIHLKFKSLEDALNYAKTQGLRPVITQGSEQKLRLQSYADNFKHDRVKC